MLGSEQGLVGGFQGFGLPGPARLGLTCLLAGSELGWGPRMPEASPPQELRPQQLLEFKNKAVSSADISVSGLKGHRSSPGAPGGPVGCQGPPSLQPRGLPRALPSGEQPERETLGDSWLLFPMLK